MQRTMIVTAVACLFIGSAARVGAADKPKAPTTRPATTQTAAKKPVNKFCAVESDNKIDPKVTYVYQGKTIGFCCRDCLEDFQKDPDRYMRGLK
jgi:YHS domain-containing protein